MSTNHAPTISVMGNVVEPPVAYEDDVGLVCDFAISNPHNSGRAAQRSTYHVRCRGTLAANVRDEPELVHKGAWVRITGRLQVYPNKALINATDVAASLYYAQEWAGR